jgi:hypothetical protein
MPNVQQPEMRRSGQTRLVQDSDGPTPGGKRPHKERRKVPAEQLSQYGPEGQQETSSDEPKGRPAEGE